MKVSIFYITPQGRTLAEKIQDVFPESEVSRYSPEKIRTAWNESGGLVCIMASGIVVRTIAPLIEDKKTDPAVVVIDENGEYVISLLSGHLGGANELAREIAAAIGGRAVITTASDVQGKTALDLWARERGLYVEDYEKIKRLSMKIVSGGRLKLYSDFRIENLPGEIDRTASANEAEIVVSEKKYDGNALFLRPPCLFAGIGCNRGTTADEITWTVREVFEENNLSINSLKTIATADLKKDEGGLTEAAEEMGVKIKYYSIETLNEIADAMGMKSSPAVFEATGARAVAEPAALAAARELSVDCGLLIPKIKRGNVTLAIAKAEYTL